MSSSNIISYEIDRKLNAAGDQSQLYQTLIKLHKELSNPNFNQTYFIPKLLELFEDTPFHFIKYKIAAILREFSFRQNLFANSKQQIFMSLNQILNSNDKCQLKLILEFIQTIPALFNESLTMYHILLGKLISKKQDNITPEILQTLNKLLKESTYLSGMFIKNYGDIFTHNHKFAFQLLSNCKITHPQLTKIIIYSLNSLNEQKKNENKFIKQLWKIVWRQIPYSPHLSEYLIKNKKDFQTYIMKFETLLKRISSFHPFLIADQNLAENQTFLDSLYIMKNYNLNLPQLSGKLLNIIQNSNLISNFQIQTLLLFYYSDINYDSQMALKSIQHCTLKHIKVFLTIGYYTTAAKIITYLLDTKLSPKQYRRLLFYHRISTLKNTSYIHLGSLKGLSKYRKLNSLECLYTQFILNCVDIINLISKKSVISLESLQKNILNLQKQFKKISFGHAKACFRVIQQMVSMPYNQQSSQISVIEKILKPHVPVYFLDGSADGVKLAIIYYPKFVYLQKSNDS